MKHALDLRGEVKAEVGEVVTSIPDFMLCVAESCFPDTKYVLSQF
jgi:hypothetical protein